MLINSQRNHRKMSFYYYHVSVFITSLFIAQLCCFQIVFLWTLEKRSLFQWDYYKIAKIKYTDEHIWRTDMLLVEMLAEWQSWYVIRHPEQLAVWCFTQQHPGSAHEVNWHLSSYPAVLSTDLNPPVPKPSSCLHHQSNMRMAALLLTSRQSLDFTVMVQKRAPQLYQL